MLTSKLAGASTELSARIIRVLGEPWRNESIPQVSEPSNVDHQSSHFIV
jgi:hypothetical protein